MQSLCQDVLSEAATTCGCCCGCFTASLTVPFPAAAVGLATRVSWEISVVSRELKACLWGVMWCVAAQSTTHLLEALPAAAEVFAMPLTVCSCPAADSASLLPSALCWWLVGRLRVRWSQSGWSLPHVPLCCCCCYTRTLVVKVFSPLADVSLHVLNLTMLAWNECMPACRLAGAAHLPSALATYCQPDHEGHNVLCWLLLDGHELLTQVEDAWAELSANTASRCFHTFLAESSSSRTARWMSSTPASSRALAFMILGWPAARKPVSSPSTASHKSLTTISASILIVHVTWLEVQRGVKASDATGLSIASVMLLSPKVFALAASLILSITNRDRLKRKRTKLQVADASWRTPVCVFVRLCFCVPVCVCVCVCVSVCAAYLCYVCCVCMHVYVCSKHTCVHMYVCVCLLCTHAIFVCMVCAQLSMLFINDFICMPSFQFKCV